MLGAKQQGTMRKLSTAHRRIVVTLMTPLVASHAFAQNGHVSAALLQKVDAAIEAESARLETLQNLELCDADDNPVDRVEPRYME
jgi:hypothetical protein